MKLQSTVTATDRKYAVNMSHHEALVLTRIMASIDMQTLAKQLADEIQADLLVTEEMTAAEVRAIMETMTVRAADQILEYSMMCQIINDLKALNRL
jgi:hypothetical protein